jgi:hypothetical protein
MAARKWTQEQRERQAKLIRTWQPWLSSTGPKTEEGKRLVAANAYRGAQRPKLRQLSKEVNELLRELLGQLSNLESEMMHDIEPVHTAGTSSQQVV